jgi:mannose-6-phosphate isomerase-like protein (cupin superfamily)
MGKIGEIGENMRLILLFLFAAVSGVFSVSAQEGEKREPSAPLRPFVIKSRQSLADLEKSLQGGNRVEDLVGGAGMQLRVAVQHDEKRDASEAESHDASDDVYYVLEGSAELTLGGRLDDPREISKGEWRAARIVGGQTFTITKGDLVIVPRGTPHHRINTKGKKFSLILIKVFEEPLPGSK